MSEVESVPASDEVQRERGALLRAECPTDGEAALGVDVRKDGEARWIRDGVDLSADLKASTERGEM